MIIRTLFALLTLLTSQAFAWGGRGHSTICEAASFLVKEPGLREFLMSRPHVMGHLCNIPDVGWKSLGGDAVKLGSPAHYFDVDLLNIPIEKIPANFQQIEKDFTGKEKKVIPGTIVSVATDVGSLWWRADQFYRLATATPEKWKDAQPPQNWNQEQDANLEYNKLVYSFMLNLGLLGHFIGDNSQPLHTNINFDGWMTGNGGLHFYFEDQVVGAIDSHLFDKVAKQAKKFQARATNRKTKAQVPFLTAPNVIEKSRQLTIFARRDFPKLLAADKVLAPSTKTTEKGMELKTPAKRLPAAKTVKRFEPLIVEEFARSASTLASIWDAAYVQIGRPDLSPYRYFKYPLNPDFVAPDYTSAAAP